MNTQLKIGTPCTADWNKMSGDEQKRFCTVCNKHVHNFQFTESDQVLTTYLTNIQNGTCGRLPASGLVLEESRILSITDKLVRLNAGRNLAFAILTVGSLLAAECNAQVTDTSDEQIIEILLGDVILPEPPSGIGFDYIPTFEEWGPVFTIVEKMPEFPGGTVKLREYLEKNMRYPAYEKSKSISGVVYVSFVIDKEGKVTEPRVLKSVKDSENFDAEALRLVNSMPLWIPGQQHGKNVNVQYNLPIRFVSQ